MQKIKITSFFRINKAYNAITKTHSLSLEKSKGKNPFLADLFSADSFLLAPCDGERCHFESLRTIIYSEGDYITPLIFSPYSGRSLKGEAEFSSYYTDHVFLFDVIDRQLEIYTVKKDGYINADYIGSKFRRGDFKQQIEKLRLLAK